MRAKSLTVLLCLLLLSCAACAPKGGAVAVATQTPAPSATPNVSAAACRLLSADDVREVQGEAPQEAQGGEHVAGGLSMSQCFFRLPTFSKSVNVEVVRAAADASALKEYWRKRFHPEEVEARERERELKEEREREREEELKRERAAGQTREGGHEEEEKDLEGEDSRPQRVPRLGEEAYLTGNRINATLFVLKGDAVLRVSVGGPEDRPDKLKRAAVLAARALKRL